MGLERRFELGATYFKFGYLIKLSESLFSPQPSSIFYQETFESAPMIDEYLLCRRTAPNRSPAADKLTPH